jgi:hypothetical protein
VIIFKLVLLKLFYCILLVSSLELVIGGKLRFSKPTKKTLLKSILL